MVQGTDQQLLICNAEKGVESVVHVRIDHIAGGETVNASWIVGRLTDRKLDTAPSRNGPYTYIILISNPKSLENILMQLSACYAR